MYCNFTVVQIKVGEYRRGNHKGTIQKHWQHRVHNTNKNKSKAQCNMCWTPLCAKNTNNVNKTSALLQTIGSTDHRLHAEIVEDFTELNKERKDLCDLIHYLVIV